MKRSIRTYIITALLILSIGIAGGCSKQNKSNISDNKTEPVTNEANATTGTDNDNKKSTTTKQDEGKLTQESNSKEQIVSNLSVEDQTTLEGYELVADNEEYELYLYESTLSVIIRNKATGALMESTLSDAKDDGVNNKTWNGYMRSGIVLTAIKGTTDTYQVDLVTCENTINISYQEDGFSAEIYFTEYEFGLTVNVRLDGNALVVNVADDSIIENGVDTYIGTVSLYPFMGYTYLDSQEGYMLIPDGNGALIYLDNKDKKYSSGFSQMIYGKDYGISDQTSASLLMDDYDTVIDVQQVLAPIYGMVHLDNEFGYLAIVEEGEKRASIEAHPNGVMVGYNRCFAKFIERMVYVQPLNKSGSGTMSSTMSKVETDRTHSDLQVRYLFVTEEEANYSGLAVEYRNYLLENNLVTSRDTDYKTRVDFLGTDREEWLITTKAVTMTTTEQIATIYQELKEAGVNNLLSVYKGWQSGGLYNVPITKFKADSKIGGTSSLTNLIKDSAEDGYDLYLYSDGLRVNPSETSTLFNVVKKINKRTLEEVSYSQVYQTFRYLMPNKADSNLTKLIESYSKKGVANMALSGISNTLYSYSYKSKYYSRYDCADSYLNTISTINDSANLILEQPFAYLWNDTKAFLDMPLGSSKYMYIDEEVPFLSMVLKGTLPMYSDYVNFEANKDEFMLQMIEAGVYPSFYLTYKDSSELIYTNSSDLYSTQYDTYKDIIVTYDHIFSELSQLTEGSYIVAHEKPQNQTTKVTYDNGVVIYINYNEAPVTIDGVQVDGMSYKVGEAHE